MFNRSEIMKSAWARYHTVRCEAESRAVAKGFLKERFRNCLKAAWSVAKQRANNSQDRIRSLQAEIFDLQFKSFRVDIAAERERLQSEIEALAA